MRLVSVTEVAAALPARFNTLVAWSSESGDDCSAIRGEHYIMFFDSCEEMWFIQAYTTYDDPSVGIFGEMEPGRTVTGTSDVLSAMHDFVTREAGAEVAQHCSLFERWIASAERAEEKAG